MSILGNPLIAGGKVSQSLSGAVVTLAQESLTYNGQAQTRHVLSVVLGGKTLTAGTDYVLSGNVASEAGSYSLTVTGVGDYEGSVSAPWSIAKAQGSISADTAAIVLDALGATEDIELAVVGDGQITAVSSDDTAATVAVAGQTVTVTAVENGAATITVTLASGNNYLGASCQIRVTVRSAKVFGVCWNYANSSTALTRLTPENDPNGLANILISSEPVPAVGNGTGSSPFDQFLPWSGMDEYNVENGVITAKKGDTSFSRKQKDTVVYIPEFWYRVMDDATNSKRYWYISSYALEGFQKHPGSGKYVGRYLSDANYMSKSGQTARKGAAGTAIRSGSKNKGSKWRMLDYMSYAAVQILYLVEFADWDSQAKIGRGQTNNLYSLIAGDTDSMIYHTGRWIGTEGLVRVQYRHIENLWSGIGSVLDGICVEDAEIYICTDPSKYGGSLSNYIDTGIVNNGNDSSWIKGLGMSATVPWAFLPNLYGGSETTYLADAGVADPFAEFRAAGMIISTEYKTCGLFSFSDIEENATSTEFGSRLIYDPDL